MEHRLILGGEQWLPFARSRIKALRAAGLRYATQRFSVDTAEIAVRLVGDHEYIYITAKGSIGIESGGIDIGAMNPADIYAVDGSTLKQATFARAAYLADDRKSAEEKALPAIRPSVVYGLPATLPGPDNTPYTYDPYTSTGAGGGPLSDIKLRLLAKKQALVGTMATRYSGKTRLLIQALMGYNPRRFTTIPDPAGAISILDGCYTLSKDTAVFCDAYGLYWLIRPSYGDAVLMRFSPEGEKIRQLLFVTPSLTMQERTTQEAYLFTTLKKFQANSDLGTSNPSHQGVSVAFSEPAGWTIAHSWHYSREGGKGIVVKHKLSPNTGSPSLSPVLAGAIYRIQFNSAGTEGNPPTIGLSGGIYSDYTISRNESSIFGVAYGLNFAWYAGMLGNIASCSAPIYAYFDDDGNEIIVQFTRTVSGAVAPGTAVPAQVAGLGTTSAAYQSQTSKSILTVTAGSRTVTATARGSISDLEAEYTVTDTGVRTTTSGSVSDNTISAYSLGSYAVPGGFAGRPANVSFPGHVFTFNLTRYEGLASYSGLFTTGSTAAAVFILPSTIDPDCIYIGALTQNNLAFRLTTHTQALDWHEDYIHVDPLFPDWTFDTYNNDSFGPKNAPAVYPGDVNTVGTDTVVQVYCLTTKHDVDCLPSASDWSYVFNADNSFARAYMVMESYGGASHVLSTYSPATYTLKDGAVLGAHLFIGYA